MKHFYLVILLFILSFSNSSHAQDLSIQELTELRERLLFAGYPTGGSGDAIDTGTLAAARLYKNDTTLTAEQLPTLLLELRNSQGQSIWVKRSDFDALQNDLNNLQNQLALAQEQLSSQERYIDSQVSSTATKWVLGITVWLFASLLGGGIFSFWQINKKIKTAAEVEKEYILDELNDKRDSIVEETEQASTSLVAGVAGRISYLMFRLLDEGLLNHNKDLEKLIKDVILDLSKNYVDEFLQLSPEKHLHQKTQQVSNIIYYMAKYYDEDQLKIHKERLESYIDEIEPDLELEKEKTKKEKLNIWAEKKLCLLFAQYRLNPARKEKIKIEVLALQSHLSDSSFEATKKDFTDIEF